MSNQLARLNIPTLATCHTLRAMLDDTYDQTIDFYCQLFMKDVWKQLDALISAYVDGGPPYCRKKHDDPFHEAFSEIGIIMLKAFGNKIDFSSVGDRLYHGFRATTVCGIWYPSFVWFFEDVKSVQGKISTELPKTGSVKITSRFLSPGREFSWSVCFLPAIKE